MENKIKSLSAEDVLAQYSNLVRKIALRTISRLPANIYLDDLLQVGNMALLEAAKNYDSSKGASFETYAGIRIKGSLIDEVRREDWLPRSAHRKSKLIEKAGEYVANNHHKTVSKEELCGHLNISEKELSNLDKSAGSYKVYNFDDIGMREDAILDNTNIDRDILASIEHNLLRKAINYNIDNLPVKERIVLILYYNNELNLKQIGDILSLTESRACQIHAKAMKTLEKHMQEWK